MYLFLRLNCLVVILVLGGVFGEFRLSQRQTTLSVGRTFLAGASTQYHAFFGGGSDNTSTPTKAVDIFNLLDNSVVRTNLGEPREKLSAVVVGELVLFAGGFNGSSFSNRVDVYNSSSMLWLPPQYLFEARMLMGATAIGQYAMFGGGIGDDGPSANLDIYDETTDSWNRTTLSFPRFDLAATSVNGIAFFAGGVNFNQGGPTEIVDLFFLGNNSWGTTNLTQARYSLVAAAIGTKAVFAGGLVLSGSASDIIDIYETTTFSWTTHHLSIPRFGIAGAVVANQLLLAGGTDISIYAIIDVFEPTAANVSLQWTNYTLQTAIWGHAGASLNNTAALFAGGASPAISNIVFIVEEIFIPPTTGTTATTGTTGVPTTGLHLTSGSATTGVASSHTKDTHGEESQKGSDSKNPLGNNIIYVVIAGVALCIILSVILSVLCMKKRKRKDKDIYF